MKKLTAYERVLCCTYLAAMVTLYHCLFVWGSV